MNRIMNNQINKLRSRLEYASIDVNKTLSQLSDINYMIAVNRPYIKLYRKQLNLSNLLEGLLENLDNMTKVLSKGKEDNTNLERIIVECDLFHEMHFVTKKYILNFYKNISYAASLNVQEAA